MDRARDSYARVRRDEEPDWAVFFTEADLDALDGVAHIELAASDVTHTVHAIDRLHAGLAKRDTDMTRSRAFETTALAIGYLQAGETDQGVAHARQAIELAEVVRSVRVTDRLSGVARAATAHGGSEAAQLCVRIDHLCSQ